MLSPGAPQLFGTDPLQPPTPPSSHLLPLPQHPSLTPRHLLSFGAFQLFGTGPQRPLPFGTVRPNRASVRSCLAERKEQRAMFSLRSAKQGQTKALCSVLLTEGLPPFDQIGPNGAGRKGALGVEEDRCQRAGGRRERVGAGEWVKGAGKGKGDGRKGAVVEREKDAMPERRWARRKGAVPKRRRAYGGSIGGWGGGDATGGGGEQFGGANRIFRSKRAARARGGEQFGGANRIFRSKACGPCERPINPQTELSQFARTTCPLLHPSPPNTLTMSSCGNCDCADKSQCM